MNRDMDTMEGQNKKKEGRKENRKKGRNREDREGGGKEERGGRYG
jgi:hypothetical protein